MQLATEAVLACLGDAGIEPASVDAMATYSMDNNPEIEIHRLIGGRELKFFSRTFYGGGAACAPLLHGAMAIASGVAEVAVVYRAMNERSGFRFGQGALMDSNPNNFEHVHLSWYMSTGLMTPASWIAMSARRYMHQYGATSEDFGRVSVAARDFAATNPAAFFFNRPITLADHQQSRIIADPLRLLDCCQESDGACALVMVAADRARDLIRPPVYIKAAAQAASQGQQMMTNYYRDDIAGLPEMKILAKQLYDMADTSAREIQTAVLYDHFTPMILPQLEAFGFCPEGEARHFIHDQQHARDGILPVNTHGGQLGEAYIHGMNGILEAVRQMRGQSVNQIEDAHQVIVTAGSGVPTSGLILSNQK